MVKKTEEKAQRTHVADAGEVQNSAGSFNWDEREVCVVATVASDFAALAVLQPQPRDSEADGQFRAGP